MEVRKNGYVDSYPHNDFDGPCTGPCCEPEAYGPGPHWTCQGGCGYSLWQPGECVECCEHAEKGPTPKED